MTRYQESLLALAEIELATTGLLSTSTHARLLNEGIDPQSLISQEEHA